jgi:hypothetical protein
VGTAIPTFWAAMPMEYLGSESNISVLTIRGKLYWMIRVSYHFFLALIYRGKGVFLSRGNRVHRLFLEEGFFMDALNEWASVLSYLLAGTPFAKKIL